MKKILLLFSIIIAPYIIQAQILKPVKWSYGEKRISNTEAVIFIKATIDDGWHIYSQNIKDGGPTKTIFTYARPSNYTLIGKTTEPTPISHYDKVFGMQVGYFEHEVIFQQKIKLASSGPVTVKGKLEFGTCNDHQCLPPEDVPFSVQIL
jgi:DsbC/DsbD-like thiol-disulfide interchange protein